MGLVYQHILLEEKNIATFLSGAQLFKYIQIYSSQLFKYIEENV